MSVLLDHLRQRMALRLFELQSQRREPRVPKRIVELPATEDSGAPRGKPFWVAPYTPAREYGHLRSPFIHDRDHPKIRLVGRDKVPFNLRDLCEHKIVEGGSGTGKTYSVLNFDLEEFFRATHLAPEDGRDEKKCCGLIIDPQGDFRARAWWIALKYDRTADMIYFGPDQDSGYDLFGDETESAQQLANKFLEMLSAFSGGQKSNDPFWDNNARKLGMNIFLLHRKLAAAAAAAPAEMKAELEFPPMSFPLLNLIMMDRGTPRNADAIASSNGILTTIHDAYERDASRLVEAMVRLDAALGQASSTRVELADELSRADNKRAADPSDDNVSAVAAVGRRLALLDAALEEFAFRGTVRPLREAVEELRRNLGREASETDEATKTDLLNANGNLANALAAGCRQRLQGLPDGTLRSSFLAAAESAIAYVTTRERLVKFRPVAPEHGMLRRMLAAYEKHLETLGVKPQDDLVWSYFNEEFLAVANEKTAGSVGMTATSMIALFAHEPFDHIFRPQRSFTMEQIIDEGKVLYLDIHVSRFGKAAEVALLAMKMDWFRATLSRPDLRKRSPDGRIIPGTQVNQTRYGFYFCDEFGTVATTGDTTGEAGYLDKVRKFDIACILGCQSHTVLFKRLPENETKAIFSNCAFKVFLRNTDLDTIRFASEVMGSEIKVSSNMQSGAAESFFASEKNPGHQGFSTNFTKGARFDTGAFTKLAKGEAIIQLPPRFAPTTVHKVQYRGHPVADPAKGKGPPVPGGAIERRASEAQKALEAAARAASTPAEESDIGEDPVS